MRQLLGFSLRLFYIPNTVCMSVGSVVAECWCLQLLSAPAGLGLGTSATETIRCVSSPFNAPPLCPQINFGENKTQTKLCQRSYTKEGKGSKARKSALEFLRERIHENYMQQWVIDNMPVTWCYAIMESDKPFCTTRFPVGCYVTETGQRHDACFLSVSVGKSVRETGMVLSLTTSLISCKCQHWALTSTVRT